MSGATGSYPTPLRVAVVGCGRIGQLHAALLAREVPGLALAGVADAVPAAAEAAAAQTGARVRSIEEVMEASDVDAVAICTSTDTHVDLIEAASFAGKAVFCEKPVSLDLARVQQARATVEAAGIVFAVGFNRRFDPGHASVRQAVALGQVGAVHLVRITSRDPAPPPLDYLSASGGLFMDMAIHDFDMAAYVTGSEVVEVYARGAALIDPQIAEAGDIDTAVTVLTHANGAITTIDNSRQAVYGYDQRVEAFGALGMATSENQRVHQGWLLTGERASAMPLPWFFLERYRDAYRLQWKAFGDFICQQGPAPAGMDDAVAATAVALAAQASLRQGRPIAVAEVLA